MNPNDRLSPYSECSDASRDMQLSELVLNENRVLYAKIAGALQCEENDVPPAIREVIRFLMLVAEYPTGKLTPSHRVDLAWHEFILCTRAYGKFCDETFGRMIHHYPGGSEASNRHQFGETLRLYQSRFGTPNPYYWGSQNRELPECGACESS